jgi:hypothetical protein
VVLVAALACGKFGPGDLSRAIALEVIAPDSLEEYDTITPRARLLDGRGDSVAATIVWFLPDSTDTTALRLIDTTTGRMTVNHTGLTGRLLARSGTFVSNPVSIRTLAAADSVFATGTTADTVILSVDSLSDSLTVELVGDSLTVGLAGRPVVYTITQPPAPGPVTLVTLDSMHALVTTDTVTTGLSGIAFVKLRLLAPPVPDSAVVTASARRAVGSTVPGSPVTFVVKFHP